MIGSVGYNPNVYPIYKEVITHLLTIDPNFLGHPSWKFYPFVQIKRFDLGIDRNGLGLVLAQDGLSPSQWDEMVYKQKIENNMLIRCMWPPPSNSDHQEYHIFSRGSL